MVFLAALLVQCTAEPAGQVVRGRVVWAGPVPVVAPIPAAIPDGTGWRFTEKPNPFAPKVTDGGLGEVVVSLVGPAAAGWPHPPATVEQDGHELHVRQADRRRVVGLVPVGGTVRFVTRDPGPATIRLRGAAFVTLPFPAPEQPTDPRFGRPGVVEVTSGTMLAWAACDLVVCDHPFHAVTNADGRFTLADVPAGEYRLTVRVRDWRQTGHDRDPETGLISRRRFATPVVIEASIRVPGELVTITVDASRFGDSPKR